LIKETGVIRQERIADLKDGESFGEREMMENVLTQGKAIATLNSSIM